jgi:hypothetical protein
MCIAAAAARLFKEPYSNPCGDLGCICHSWNVKKVDICGYGVVEGDGVAIDTTIPLERGFGLLGKVVSGSWCGWGDGYSS